MDSTENLFDDDYDERCGEIFLTAQGKLIFHCTNCEDRFKGFKQYVLHLEKQHNFNLENETLNCGTNNFLDCIDNDCARITENDNLNNENKFELCDFQIRNIDATKCKENQRNFKCPYCNFSCKYYSNLLGHKKRHSTNKPFNCTYCSKSFYTKFEVQKHIRRHTGERPYLCSFCGQAFITLTELSMHTKRHYKNKDKHCKICGMNFYNNALLKQHMTVHSIERPYQCYVCNADFKLRKTLKNHHKIHENKLEYTCKLCPAKYNQLPGLRSHLKKKHFNIF